MFFAVSTVHLRRMAAADLSELLTAPPRQQRGRDRQQALIEAGLQLTAARDWADVTVGDIAAAIGCSVGTFYTRFHNKEAYFDVLLGLMTELMQQRADTFYAAPERQSETPAQFIASWVALVLQSFSMHRGLYAAAVLGLRRLRPEMAAASPLLRLRDQGREQFAAAMARRPGWRSAAARQRLQFAPQLLQGVLINAVLTDPGPLHLDDAALQPQLVAALCAYLGLQAPERATP
ncbi:MAG: TetR/AcrR family transcriptional regulator [Rhodoferax sp.]|nr:TetR/AcrR family transcriptional regulator [Rhodoferax sp.]